MKSLKFLNTLNLTLLVTFTIWSVLITLEECFSTVLVVNQPHQTLISPFTSIMLKIRKQMKNKRLLKNLKKFWFWSRILKCSMKKCVVINQLKNVWISMPILKPILFLVKSLKKPPVMEATLLKFRNSII